MRKFFLKTLVIFFSLLSSIVSAEDLKELFTKAKSYYDGGNYEEAVKYFEQAVEVNPNFAPSFNYLGLAYRDAGWNINEVIWYFKVAIDIDPNYAEAYENLGKTYYGLGDFDNAAENCEKALSLNPKSVSAQLALGWIYLVGKNKPDQAKYYFKMVTERVNIPNAYYGLGLSYFMNGENALVLEMITALRMQEQEKLATQLEDIVRGQGAVPSQAASLVNVSKHPESQPGVVVGNEIIETTKTAGEKTTQSPGGPTAQIRMRGQMVSTAEPQKSPYTSSIDPTRARTPQEESAAIQRVRALQSRQGRSGSSTGIFSGTINASGQITPNSSAGTGN